MNIEEALAQNYLEKISVDQNLIKKELKEAEADLDKAKDDFGEKNYKWCIIESYYSMFHAAKAVLFSIGFREKRHFVIRIVLENLVKDGKLESRFVNDFTAAMNAREDADYRYLYSQETAQYLLQIAGEFLEKMRGMVR